MIAHISGMITYKSPEFLIIDVNGVGYQVFIPLSTYYNLPAYEDTINIKIYTHIKDESINLYGFLSNREKEIFTLLLSINGIGPKMALNILSRITPDEFIQCVKSGDVARLSSTPGLGKKTVGRIILELTEKIDRIEYFIVPIVPEENQLRGEAVSALVNLGYKTQRAQKTVDEILNKKGTHIHLEDLIKESLNVIYN
ncbi:MAG: Holliday junction branch migration protein RuvA [Thermodesulfobacteriota bacterium]|nr:Holliday junction branch migration protein RuvA [Thermodesulfobacteriota bacterium]